MKVELQAIRTTALVGFGAHWSREEPINGRLFKVACRHCAQKVSHMFSIECCIGIGVFWVWHDGPLGTDHVKREFGLRSVLKFTRTAGRLKVADDIRTNVLADDQASNAHPFLLGPKLKASPALQSKRNLNGLPVIGREMVAIPDDVVHMVCRRAVNQLDGIAYAGLNAYVERKTAALRLDRRIELDSTFQHDGQL